MSIKLKSNDNQEFDITPEACNVSRFLQNKVKEGNKEIELEDIKGEILKLVVDYLNHYSNNEIPKIPEVLQRKAAKPCGGQQPCGRVLCGPDHSLSLFKLANL